MARIPHRFINATLAVGTRSISGDFWVASAFLYGQLTSVSERRLYTPLVVSNKHVLENQDHVILRFNPYGSAQPMDIYVNLSNTQNAITPVHFHPTLDLAAFPLEINPAYGITLDTIF